jgi:hypothetical protein
MVILPFFLGFIMDTLFAFFAGIATGYLLTWPALIIMIFCGILSEHNESRGWSMFFGIVVMISSYFFFNVSLETIAYYVAAYVVIGLLWSFWRYKRFVTAGIESINLSSPVGNNNYNNDFKLRQIANLHPAQNLDKITAWIIVWPFSMIENVTGDLISLVHTLITKVFKGVYHKIYMAAAGDLLDKYKE